MRFLSALLSCLLIATACNQAPEGLKVTLSPESPTTSDSLEVVVDVEASDKNGDAVTYTYQWRVDDNATGETESILSATRTKKHETWEVTVTPGDGELTGVAATATVTILNSPPTAILSLSEPNPETDERIQIITDTDDADFDKVTMSYEWIVGGETTEHTGYTLAAEHTEKGQSWEVIGTPTDDEVDGEPVSVSFTIGNTAPEIEGAVITPLSVNRGDTVSCDGVGWYDQDGDLEGYLTAWFVNGVEVAVTEQTMPLLDYARGDQIYCELTAFDGELEGNTEVSSAVPIQNAKPSIGGVIIGPADPVNDTTIEAVITDVLDLDDDEVDVDYAWYVDGKKVGYRTYLPGDDLVRGNQVHLELTPSDTYGNGAIAVSNVLTVANTLPVISGVSLSPAAPATDDDVVATVKVKDADKDPITLTYQWYVAATLVGETTDTLSGTDFEKHDDIYVVVTPSDSEDGAAVTSGTVTAVNTLPAAPELVFNPSEPTETDDVVCEVDSQEPDLDGDTITYTVAWTVNGTAYTGAGTTTLTGDTVDADERDADDVWVCTITPHDGDETGPAGRIALGVEDPTGLDFTGATVNKTKPRGGSYSGTSYDESCGTGEVLVGMSGYLTASPYVASLATRCAEMSFSCVGTTCTATTGSITTGTFRGGKGTAFVRDCPSGSVVTGFVGKAGWYMDQVKLRCMPITAEYDGSDWEVVLGTYSDLSAAGGTGGSTQLRSDCGSGEVATSAQIKASSTLLMTLGFGCQAPGLSTE